MEKRCEEEKLGRRGIKGRGKMSNTYEISYIV